MREYKNQYFSIMTTIMGRPTNQVLEVSRELTLVAAAQILVIRTRGIMVVIISSLGTVINSRIIRVILGSLIVANIMSSLRILANVIGRSRSEQSTRLSRQCLSIYDGQK